MDKETLRNYIEYLKNQELKRLAEQKGVDYSGRGNGPKIKALMEYNWTEEEKQELKEYVKKLQNLREPKRHFIRNLLDSPSLDSLETKLKKDEPEFAGNELIEEGFEVSKKGENKLHGSFWSKSTNTKINPFGELYEDKNTYSSKFIVDMENTVVLVDERNYGKVSSVFSKLEQKGVETDSIGHNDLTHEKANEHVEDFVEQLEQKVAETNEE